MGSIPRESAEGEEGISCGQEDDHIGAAHIGIRRGEGILCRAWIFDSRAYPGSRNGEGSFVKIPKMKKDPYISVGVYFLCKGTVFCGSYKIVICGYNPVIMG